MIELGTIKCCRTQCLLLFLGIGRGPRIEEAAERSVRWLDRCLNVKMNESQNIFPIVQGGLDPEPRIKCSAEMVRRNAPGFAIGGLSGGETKDEFWRVIHNSAPLLPEDKPKYCVSIHSKKPQKSEKGSQRLYP